VESSKLGDLSKSLVEKQTDLEMQHMNEIECDGCLKKHYNLT
jgi:hypothetical protein